MTIHRILTVFLGTIFVATGGTWTHAQTPAPSTQLTIPDKTKRSKMEAQNRWFTRGRTAPTGQSSAELRLRAHQFKMHRRLRATPFVPSAKNDATAGAVSSGEGWIPLGPAPLASDASGFGLRDYGWVSGRATAVAIDLADITGNTVYLGSAYGGVWKSVNAAAALPSSVVWTSVFDDQPTLSIGSIAIQPGGTGVLLVGSGETNSSTDSYYGLGIFRSTDHGVTWSLAASSTDARSFKGMGFSKIAFSEANPSLVVAGAGFAAQGMSDGLDSGTNRGIYASTDAGVSWRYASVKDGASSITASSVTSVLYNSSGRLFLAAIRRHGFYSSTDGVNWTRLANQPGVTTGSAALSLASCPTDANNNSFACPIYRGEMAVVPSRDEVYAWFMDLPGNSLPEVDRGIWRSVGGGAWTQISSAGLTSCGDPSGCGVENGDYSLSIGAVPNGSVATDLYAGAANLYKCPLNSGATSTSCSGGAWLNLTHAYGCSEIARFHPNLHAMQFAVVSGQALGYFGNDGGIYRTLDGFMGLRAGLNGSCEGSNQFDSLNLSLGSLTQLISFSEHPTDASTLFAGAQGNGFAGTDQAETSSSFVNVLSGDGGHTLIQPSTPTRWLAAVPDVAPGGLEISSCEFGIDCRSGNFAPVVSSSDLGGDDGDFYVPYIFDPQADTQLLVGTCRVWRAAIDRSTFTQLSNNFDTGAGGCSGNEANQVRALAAGGPRGVHGFSNVVYATTDGSGPILGPTNPPGGRVFVSVNADSATPSFADVTANINPKQFPVSSVAIDAGDVSGQTAYVTIMGFGVSHVFKTANAGGTWSAFGSVANGLPDAPANAALIDAATSEVYVGTDTGVFVSPTSSPSWVEVGIDGSVHLPSVPVTALRLFYPSVGTKKLRASTYGRGLWEYNLIVTPDFRLQVANPSRTIFAGQQATFNGSVTPSNGYASTVTLSCAGTTPSTCVPNPISVIPTAGGSAFSVRSTGTTGDYPFRIRAVGSDTSHITQEANVALKVVDYAIGELNPSSVTVVRSAVSGAMTFAVTATGPLEGSVLLSCPTGLPAAASCQFSPSNSVQPTPANPITVSLTVATGNTTPAGTFPVTIQAQTAGAPSPKTQVIGLTVTAGPDYALAVNNSPLSLKVGQAGEFIGTLTSVNGYSQSVTISCGTGAPTNCSGGSFVPSAGGAQFQVSTGGNAEQTYHFNLMAKGADTSAIEHSVPVTLNLLADFVMTSDSGSQTIAAGGTATYLLDVTPGGTSFSNNVTFSCSSSSLPPLARCVFRPASIAGGSGASVVTVDVTTTASTASLGSEHEIFFAMTFPLLGLMGVGLQRRRLACRWRRTSRALVFALTLWMSACGGGYSDPGGGGGHPGTPPGTYSVQVGAICGATSRQVTLLIVVQ
jgi:hypothetical protein